MYNRGVSPEVKKLVNVNVVAILRMMLKNPSVRKSELTVSYADDNLLRAMSEEGLIEISHLDFNDNVTTYARLRVTEKGREFKDMYEELIEFLDLDDEVKEAIDCRKNVYRSRKRTS